MESLKLYYPDGERAIDDAWTFVAFYSQVYFFAAGNNTLERKMDKLLHAEELTRDDIADILVWKTGGHLNQDAGVISCGYNTKIRVTEVAKLFDGKKAPHMAVPADTLCGLCKCQGIGFTYAMALMYFLSCGNIPIYDRFAHLALAAIQEGRRPGEIIPEGRLVLSPTIRNKDDAQKALDLYRKKFALLLTGNNLHEPLLGIPYSRDADRALWAYGHLFNKTKRNKFRLSTIKHAIA